MSRGRQIEFPELGNLSTLEYYKLLQAGKKLTRHATRTATEPPPTPPKPQKRPPKRSPHPVKKRKPEAVVPPSPPEEKVKLNYLEGCVYGSQITSRRVWVKLEDTWKVDLIEDFEAVSGEDLVPSKYKIGANWVDLRQVEAFLGGRLMEYQGKPVEILWYIPGPQSDQQILVKGLDGGEIDSVYLGDLTEYYGANSQALQLKLAYQTWLNANRDFQIPDSDIEKYYFWFVKIKNYKQKVVLLRKHPVTEKLFIYNQKQFKWINYEPLTLVCQLTEPPVPVSLLLNLTPGSDLRKQYKDFFLNYKLPFPSTPTEDKIFRKENRCKCCGYILDILEFRQCDSCGVCYHTQCLEDVTSLVGLRGVWRCPDCPRCESCLGIQGKMVKCSVCNNNFHERCLDLSVAPSPAKRWICELCAVCEHCGIKATEGNVKWNETITKCTSCDMKWKKGEYCPVCFRFWFSKKGRQSRTEQRLSRKDDPAMIECDKCRRWVHINCDTGINTETWGMLINNQNMKYYCPVCREANQNKEMYEVVTQLMELEKNNFFVKKVDDPYYNKVIKNQMYFEKMLENAQEGVYSKNKDLLWDHFELMCENAMCFFKANTNGYQTAEKLLQEGQELLQTKLFPHKRKKPEVSLPTKKLKSSAKNIPDLDLPLPSELEEPMEYDFSQNLLSLLPELSFSPLKESLNIVINKKDIQPYIGPKLTLSFYPTPLAILYTDCELCLEEQCFVCGSFIQEPYFKACLTCGRAFHSFCVDANSKHWHCKDCRVCEICKDIKDAFSMIDCSKCSRGYHVNCLWPSFTGQFHLSNWVCDKCFECKRCGASNYHELGFEPTKENFYTDFELCYKCAWVLENKKYCPECEKDWCSPYNQVEEPQEMHFCKPCGFYFHKECFEDWKGCCSKCTLNSMNYAQAEKLTLEKIQYLMSLISQSSVYKQLTKDCIERRFGIDEELAKELAEAFLADNSEFLANSPEMRELFQGRGVEIVKTKTSRKPFYRTTSLPMVEGLRRSELLSVTYPIVKLHRFNSTLKVYDVEWDTSCLMNSLNSIYNPTDQIEVVEEFVTPISSTGMFVHEEKVWDFTEINLNMSLPRDSDQMLYERCYWLGSDSDFVPPLKESEPEETRPEPLKPVDTPQDVLTQELSSEQLAELYVKQELPAAIAFADKFETWLQENIVKLTLHFLNRSEAQTPESSCLNNHSNGLYRFEPKEERLLSLSCSLCKHSGESKLPGRLLPVEDGIWVHVNCAYWSSEVTEDELGGLQNFIAALTKSKKTKCKDCGELGATICCSAKKCHNSYHFPCALLGNARLLKPKSLICNNCSVPKSLSNSEPVSTEDLVANNHRKLFVSKGKKFSRKPMFVRDYYNRIGSVIFLEIPEEGIHERFKSIRRCWMRGKRVMVKCENENGTFKASLINHPQDPGHELMRSQNLEELWPMLKQGESFVMKSASDFFGYPMLSNFLPPIPQVRNYKPPKEPKPKSIFDILKKLERSPFGASSIAPYTKHTEPKPEKTMPVTSQKSVNYQESFVEEIKDENSLVSDFRKYKKDKNKIAQLEVLPSRIHGLGLYTSVDIPLGNIVVEYIGEIIRNKVADLREKEYEKKGIGNGSCYMFRMDSEKVVDATVKGGKARFINHSCEANCEARVCEIDGEKHILFTAKRLIHKGEEITFDYQFEVEQEKIQCFCGSKDCQGKLN